MDRSPKSNEIAVSPEVAAAIAQQKERLKRDHVELGKWVRQTVHVVTKKAKDRPAYVEELTLARLLAALRFDLSDVASLGLPAERLASLAPPCSSADSRDFVPMRGSGLELLPKVDHLFGPANEVVRRLGDALESPSKRAVCVLGAVGGIGKSGLVGHFLRRFTYPLRVQPVEYFVYGFNDRRRHGNPSTEDFFHRALECFGSNGLPHWSARRLADQLCDVLLERDSRLILVLDGLETLQRPLSPQLGEFVDIAAPVGIFLRRYIESTTASRGLCVMTSRLGIVELSDCSGYHEMPLDLLDREQGAVFLRQMGVTGADEQIADASEQFGGHLLTLNLLATYLRDWAAGQISRLPAALSRASVESRLASNLLTAPNSADQGNSRLDLARFDGIMQCFAERYSGPPLELLRLLSLFDGAVNLSRLATTLGAAESELEAIVERLAPTGFLQQSTASRKAPISGDYRHGEALSVEETRLDLHPWVREFFATRYAAVQIPQTQLDMQRRIRDAFLADSSRIAAFSDVQNLHAAVVHGCRAGEVRQAFWDIYWSNLAQINAATGEAQFWCLRRFGRFGDELQMLESFYLSPWDRLHPALDPRARGLVLGVTGFCARANGDLPLSRQLFEKSLCELNAFGGDPVHACRVAGFLSESLRSLGELRRAHDAVTAAVAMADRLGYRDAQIDKLTILADILHFQGKLEDSQAWFAKARDVAGGSLTGIPSVRWCELLLTLGRFAELVEQATRAIEEQSIESDLLPGALHTLYLGASWMQLAGQDDDARERGRQHIERGMGYLQMAGMLEHLAMGHILVAGLHLKSEEYEAAAEALLAARGTGQLQSARLIEVDWKLTSIELHLASPATNILARANLPPAPVVLDELLSYVHDEYGLQERRAVDLQKLVIG